MSQGLKSCAKIITNSVSVAQGHVNINKTNADLHITIPLLQTIGLAKISPTLIFCNSKTDEVGLFGRGVRLNYYKGLTGFEDLSQVENADFSTETYNYEHSMLLCCPKNNTKIKKVYDDEYGISYHFELEDKLGNIMYFPTCTSKYPEKIKMKNGDRFILDFVSDIKTISNTKGDVIKFSGTTNIELVEYYHNDELVYKTVIEYSSSNYISRVIGYNNVNEILFNVSLDVFSSSVIIKDNLTNYVVRYLLSSAKVINIKTGYGTYYQRGSTLNIEYFDYKTKITNDLGETNYVYYNSSNYPRVEIDDFGNAVEMLYDQSKDLLTYKSSVVLAKEKPQNLLYSEKVTPFTKTNIEVETITTTLPTPFDEILGDSVRKCSGKGNLKYRVNRPVLPNDVLTLSIWGRELSESINTFKVGIQLKLIKGTEETSTTRIFDRNQVDGDFNFFTLGLCADKSYDAIEIEIIFMGYSCVELGGVQLLQKNAGAYYEYDSNSNLLEYGIIGQTGNLYYNDDNDITDSLDKDSELYKYEYDSRKLLTKVITPYQTKLENSYDGYNNIIKSSIYKNNLKIMESSRTYLEGRFLNTETDENGNVTTYTFDDKYGYLKKVVDALSITTSYDYYDDGLLKCIKLNNNPKTNYTYENNKLKTITLENGSVYEFEYDDYENIIRVKLNGETIYRFEYNDKNNIIKQYYGENSGYYEFIYSNYTLLTQVKYVNGTDVKICYNFLYDDLKRIKSIETVGVCTEEYTYDNEGRVLEVSREEATVKYNYDNSGNIIGVVRDVDDKKIHQSFNSVSRTKGIHMETLIESEMNNDKNIELFMSTPNSINNGDIELINHDGTTPSVVCSEVDNIPCAFIDQGNLLSYKTNLGGTSASNKGTVAFWFKQLIDNPFYLFSIKSTNGSDFIAAYVDYTRRVIVKIVDATGENHYIILSNRSINAGQWNYFALSFINGEEKDGITLDRCEYIMNLNGECHYYIKENPRLDFNLNNQAIFNIGHKYNGESSSDCAFGYIAALMINGKKALSNEEIIKYYQMSRHYVIERGYSSDGIMCTYFSQTTLFTESTTTQVLFDIVPLQNNFTSFKNNLPIISEKRILSPLDRDRTFAYNNLIKRFAYMADGNELVYDFGFTNNEGTILMRAYTDVTDDRQYFLDMVDEQGRKLSLFRNKSRRLCVDVNGVIKETNLVFKNNEWQTIGITFGLYPSYSTTINSIIVSLDDATYTLAKSITQPYGGLRVMIGRSFDDTKNGQPLYGQIEMLSVKTRSSDLTELNLVREELYGYTKISAFDELGMLKKKEIHYAGTPILSTEYTYKYKDGSDTMITRNISSEKIKSNEAIITNRNYTTDVLGRVTSITDSLFGNHSYQYDGRGFLVLEDDAISYAYDENGNITQKGNISYTYDSIIKDKLISYGDKIISYHENMPGYISSYDGKTFNYEGNRLVEISSAEKTISYVYNYQGQRIRKTIVKNGVLTATNYYYDGNMLITTKCGSTRVDYLYDEYNELYGFIYENNKYFYVRDALRNIIGITSQDGELVVKYKYNAYGELLETSGSLASTIGEINPFRFKGYYYDVETGLFWCNSRYYNPEWGRWISPDSIEYLDFESINGLNLYAYCNNNPVNYVDPDGHLPKWAAWLISGAAIVGGVILCATGVGGIAGGVLIGAGAGSLINGYVNEANGGDFTAGYVGGAISGALCGVGAGFGGLAIAAASEVAGAACLGYLALGAASSFAGGFAGNLAGTVYTSWHDSGFKGVNLNWGETFGMSALMGTLNIFAGIGSAMSTVAGNMGKAAIDLNSRWAFRALAGGIAGGTEALYDLTSYLIGRII